MSAGHFPGARGFSSLFPNEIELRSEGKEPQRSKKQESKREKKKSL